jgi:hypothetical protein
MNESNLMGAQPSGMYTSTMGNNERAGRAINERPKTGMATSGAGLNTKKLISSSAYIHANKKQHINPYSKTNPTKLKPGQALAAGSQKSSLKNLNNLKIGGTAASHHNKGDGPPDRGTYPNAGQSLRKAVPQMRSG